MAGPLEKLPRDELIVTSNRFPRLWPVLFGIWGAQEPDQMCSGPRRRAPSACEDCGHPGIHSFVSGEAQRSGLMCTIDA